MVCVHILNAQKETKINMGIGVGLDYGGIGTRFTYLPINRIGLFASLGYNLDLLGYNVGSQFRFLPRNKLQWYLTVMYGYNAVLIVEGLNGTKQRATYFGPSGGLGFELNPQKSTAFFWSFEILVPIRPQSFHNTVDDLEQFGIEVKKPFPIAISVGFHKKLATQNSSRR